MALSNIQKFNWDKFLTKTANPELKRAVNIIRGKSNEVVASAAKYGKAPEPIDFAAYKNKLRFTGSAIASLENAYKNATYPTYTADVPAVEIKRRAALSAVSENLVELAKIDLAQLNAALDDFENVRITRDTSAAELADRFPEAAREVELEIKNHQWVGK